MNSRAPTRRSEYFPITQLFTSAALVLALLSGAAAPSAGVSAARLCEMDCGAGQPPHESDSCAHDSCHVALSAPESSPPEKYREPHGEQAPPCGSSK